MRVVPELDIPGHTSSWFVGDKSLSSDLRRDYAIERTYGVFQAALNPSLEGTYTMLETLLEEMSRLFPDAFFHIGGDEVTQSCAQSWLALPGWL